MPHWLHTDYREVQTMPIPNPPLFTILEIVGQHIQLTSSFRKLIVRAHLQAHSTSSLHKLLILAHIIPPWLQTEEMDRLLQTCILYFVAIFQKDAVEQRIAKAGWVSEIPTFAPRLCSNVLSQSRVRLCS